MGRLLFYNCAPGAQAVRHQNDALVLASAPGEGQGPLCYEKRPVHKDVNISEKGPLGSCPVISEVLIETASPAPHVQAGRMGSSCQGEAFLWLVKGLSAGERQAISQGIGVKLENQLLHCAVPAACRIVRLRILTPGTSVMAPLYEHSEPKPGAIDNRILYNACNAHDAS